MYFLLTALADELNNAPLTADDFPPDGFEVLLNSGGVQKVLPLVFEAVLKNCPEKLTDARRRTLRNMSISIVASQAAKTEAFLGVYDKLANVGLHPVVVKGIVCRALYPIADGRVSGDEDLIIPPADIEKYYRALTEMGFSCALDSAEREKTFEVTFVHPSGLKLEVHKSFFTPQGRLNDLNNIIGDPFSDTVIFENGNTEITTLSPTKHLLYLILHAFKHFVYSGFGVRQVCDIALFTEKYAYEIDFNLIASSLKRVNADTFAAAVYNAAVKYLAFTFNEAEKLINLLPKNVSPDALVNDIMNGDIYGGNTERQHSATVTLNAYESENGKSNALKSLFPSREYLSEKYPYVKKNALLTPLAWVSRISHYAAENIGKNQALSSSLEIGKQRTELLRFYKII